MATRIDPHDPRSLARYVEQVWPIGLRRLRDFYALERDDDYDHSLESLSRLTDRMLTARGHSVDPADIDEALSLAIFHPTRHIAAGQRYTLD